MSLLKEALDAGKFGVTAEMAPPKGCDFTEQMEAAELLKGKVHGINVTDMQSACLKATGLGLCIKLKQAAGLSFYGFAVSEFQILIHRLIWSSLSFLIR